MGVTRVLVGVALACAATLGTSPSAFADRYEPNDSIADAFGPVHGGRTYTARFDTDNDFDDYFYFRSTGRRAITITMTGCAGTTLYSGDGDILDNAYGTQISHLRYRLPHRGRFFVLFSRSNSSCDVGPRYRFRIDPRAALTRYRWAEAGLRLAAMEGARASSVRYCERQRSGFYIRATSNVSCRTAKRVEHRAVFTCRQSPCTVLGFVCHFDAQGKVGPGRCTASRRRRVEWNIP